MNSPSLPAVSATDRVSPAASCLTWPGCFHRSPFGFAILSLILVIYGFLTQALRAAEIATDQWDYPPFSEVVVTGSGFDSGEEVQLQLETLDADGVTWTVLPDEDPLWPNPWTVTADAGGNLLDAWYVYSEDFLGVSFRLTATGLQSGTAAVTTFTDSAGSYSINFAAADPTEYIPPIPFPETVTPVIVGRGDGDTKIPSAWFESPVSNTDVRVESLAPEDMALHQIVPFEIKISVSGDTSPEDGVITFTAAWSTHTTSGGNFGYDPSYGVIAAFVDTGDGAHFDPGGDATVQSITWVEDEDNDEIVGVFVISGLDDDDVVVIEPWLVLKDTIPPGSTGNVQSKLVSAATVPAGTKAISTGNQTVPLLRVHEFFSADADLSVTKTSEPVCVGEDITYTIVVTNHSTDTVANGVVVTDTLGANQTFVSSSGATANQVGQVVTFDVGAMFPGQILELTVVATPTASGSVGNEVSVTAITSDPDSSDNSDSISTTVHPPPSCEIVLESVLVAGQPATLQATASMAAYEWSVSFNDGDPVPVDGDDLGELQVLIPEDATTGTVFLTTTNEFGCTSSCELDLEAISTNCIGAVPPVCPGTDQVLSLEFTPPAGSEILWSIEPDDGPAVLVGPLDETSVTVSSPTCAEFTVTVVVTPPGGSSTTCTTSGSFEDTVDPVLPTLPTGGELGCNPTPPTCDNSLEAEDDCGPVPVICSAGDIESSGCFRTQIFTYTATDACLNSASDTVTYTWTEDTVDPVLPTLPTGGDLGCNPTLPACDDSLTAEDNCGQVPVICSAGDVTGDGCIKSKIFTYTATDACLNSASDTVTFTWTEDTVDPVLPTLPTGGDLGCNPTLPVCDDSLVAEDNCGQVSVICSAGDITGEGCLKSQIFTYTATDACLNSASDTVTYTWTEDTVDPVLPTLPTGGDLGCNPTLPACDDTLMAEDNCGQVPVDCSAGEIEFDGCFRSQVFTYTAIDACGNDASDSVTYTWTIDVTDPVLPTLPEGGDLGCNPTLPACNDTLMAEDGCGEVPVTCSAGDITGEGCLKSQTFTYSAIDDCGNDVSDTVTYTWTEDTIDPVLPTLPTGGDLGCNPTLPTCDDTLVAEDNCGQVPVICSAGAITGDDCLKSQNFTYTATDACLNSASDTVTYTWTEDTTDPELTCPSEIVVTYPNVPAPATTVEELEELGGTASDACGEVTISSTDSEPTGDCPRSIIRTYKAVDDCGNEATCDQTITQLCPSLVTSSSLCTFDVDQTCEDAFRLAFHQRPDSPSLWRITNSNPGQFYYNVFVTGNQGDPVDMAINIPYPFVTHGAQPIHVYSDYTVTGSEESGYCLVPGTGAAGFTIGTGNGADGVQNYSPNGAEIIVLGDYGAAFPTSTVTVSGGTIPASGTLCVTIHLDFGLKGTKEWTQSTGAAVGSGSLLGVQLDPCQEYAFSFADAGLGIEDEQVVHSVNSFKKNPGFGASIVLKSDLGGAPLKGVKFEAWDAKGTTKIGEAYTDADGAGLISYKHKSKPADYWIKVPAYQKSVKVTVKANGFGLGEFEVP